jgi:hypothetical protein
VQHPPIADELESISNERVPNHIRALKIGAWAVGALAVGTLAIGALAIGALAIGRLVIGRSRIRRLEIDELVVARLDVTESLTAPSIPAVDNDRAKKQEGEHFNQPTTVDRAINKLFGFLVGLGLGLPHNYLLQVRGRKSGRIYSTPVDVLDRDGKRYLVAPRGYTQWVRKRHRKRYGITQERTAARGVRRTFTFRRRKAGDPEVISRPLQADGAAVFPGARRLSDRGLSTIDQTVPGLRADTPAMNWAVLALCRARPFKGKVANNRCSFKVHSIYTQRIDAVRQSPQSNTLVTQLN